MKKKPILIFLMVLVSVLSFAQSIDSLKLSGSEIPAGYIKSADMICITPHACSFYDQTDMYESFLGKITKKEFQAFSKKGDEGAIMYIEFEKDFLGQSFLGPLLWGTSSKPTKSEPDDFYAKGKILVIWSFNLKSELKQISKDKVTKLLR